MSWKEIRNWFSFLFGLIGLTLIVAKSLAPLNIWNHEDWIQFIIALGTTVIGIAAVWLASRQNKILASQNELISQQNGYLANQRELNELLIKQELNRENERIKTWCKNTFRAGGHAGGMLQMNGASLRRRFPQSVPVILDAYEELKNEEPGSQLPSKREFLEYMQGIEAERDHWPQPRGFR